MSTNTRNPTSHLLNDRLRACRAESKRARRSDIGPRRPAADDDIFLQEAEATIHNAPRFDNASVASERQLQRSTTLDLAGTSNSTPKLRGIREMDDQVQKLTKDAFDLKMEVFHRRQREERLQEQVKELTKHMARVQKLEEEHAELLHINDKLVKELEKRDSAVKEAVEIICDLEAKNEQLQEDLGQVKAMAESSRHGPRAVGTPRVIPPSSPAQFTSPSRPSVATVSPSSVNTASSRVPAFLNEKKQSTRALRSAYLEPSRNLKSVKSYISLVSESGSRYDEEANQDHDILNSPRLSVLSESSFPSIYGRDDTKGVLYTSEQVNDVQYGLEDFRQRSIKRVNQWVDEDRMMSLPLRSLSQQSINRLDDMERRQTKSSRANRRKTIAPHQSIDAALYGPTALPPSPDSVGTRTLLESRANKVDDWPLDSKPGFGRTYSFLTDSTRALHHERVPIHSQITEDEHYGAKDSIDEMGMQYTQYPDGGSIDTGTPSRFQLRHVSPPAEDLMFNGDCIEAFPRSSAQRRKSSAEVYLVAEFPRQRPEFSRSETSPQAIFRGSDESAHIRSPLSQSNTYSGHRNHSPSSSQEIVPQDDMPVDPASFSEITGSVDAATPVKASNALNKSMRESLTQVKGLLRRMSNHKTESPSSSRSPMPSETSNTSNKKRRSMVSAPMSPSAVPKTAAALRQQNTQRPAQMQLRGSESPLIKQHRAVADLAYQHTAASCRRSSLDTSRGGLGQDLCNRAQALRPPAGVEAGRNSTDTAREAAVMAIGKSTSVNNTDKSARRSEKRNWR